VEEIIYEGKKHKMKNKKKRHELIQRKQNYEMWRNVEWKNGQEKKKRNRRCRD